MKLLISVVLTAVVAAILTACSGSDDPDPTPSPAVASPTFAPVDPTPTATTPSQPVPVDPSPQAPTPAGGGDTTTGDPDLDAIIQAALGGDGDALVNRIVLTSAPCTTAQGAGGPPKCDQAPGSPPDGANVEAFPVSSCELGWTYDVAAIATDFATRDLELFAVLALDLPGPLFNEPYMPELDHAVILESEMPGIGRIGHMLGIHDGAIIYLESLCGTAPETYLTDRQQIADHHEVILRGPAFRS